MLGKHEIDKRNEQSNLSMVMQKMKNTLTALGAAFDQAMDLKDPIDQTHHEIGKVTETDAKKRELMDL